MIPASEHFIVDVDKQMLSLSNKSTVLASQMKIRHVIASYAGNMGAVLKQEITAPILGIEATSSKVRRLTVSKKRFEKGNKRHKKVMKLQTKRAKKRLHATAVIPQQGYASPAIGMPLSQLHVARARYAQALGAKRGWCTATIIELEAKGCDPLVRHVHGVIA